MARRPIIGITVAHCTEELKTFPREFYVESIRKAGGQALLLPPVQTKEEAEELVSLVDGIVLTGGGDIAPVFLGEQPKRGIGGCIPERDQSEILLAQLALKDDLPILGICRGIQVLAVAAEGKIYQDIRSECPLAFEHNQTAPRECAWHEVEILDSRLSRIMGAEQVQVNSLHHQAVSLVPEGFILNAVARDGIIEGIEKLGAKFCIGVQWHPEVLRNDEYSRKLFKGFIKSSNEFA
ncbi:gamma-glutamyl-gamma-aminobutyrate hydrolase family protein [Desulfitobacterium sp.]|uniref:gamma-glutamyl-gamma-aminobutyrate hydrolase family protein n=1 Tax=Desulfitobacterium sp. TaxID=49981 RepID=UPI002C7D45C7|nr:gamma-glutamyl-gamma-aminobutyrate hydrolase family protein [Desulfitobacterium sp.]HVJ48017.1 gamma-glutamyl-gamma-aminobutyrate hydrolase family protein [Desulfitobacterium sp.]